MPNASSAQGKNDKATIDWRAIAQHMDAVRAAIEHGCMPTPEESLRILKERAQSLAQVPAQEASATDACIEVVTFQLAYEHYAIESRYVREVCALDSLTPLPCTPAFVLGIVNLRGEILSVIDIKVFFDLPAQGLTDLNNVIVLQSGNMVFGILADAITGVSLVPTAGIQASLPTLANVREAYLLGLTADRTAIIDAGKLVHDANIVVNERVDG